MSKPVPRVGVINGELVCTSTLDKVSAEWAAEVINEQDAELASLRAERDVLAEIVARLPKTADGVHVLPGLEYVWNWFALEGGFWEHIVCPSQSKWVAKCYSTREAAESARKEAP